MTATLTRPTVPAVSLPPADAPLPMSRLIRVEWAKSTDTRAARWLLALTGVSTIALMLLPLLRPGGIDQTRQSYLDYAANGVMILLPVVSIMTMTSEWTQRTVLTTFVQEPRRSRVINAKVAASLLLSGAAMVFAVIVCAAAVGVGALAGRDVSADLGVASVLGLVLFVLLNMLMGVAFGGVLQNTASAIVLFFLLPIVFGIIGNFASSVGHWINPATTFGWAADGQFDGHVPQILVSALLWVVLPLAAGLARTARREIK